MINQAHILTRTPLGASGEAAERNYRDRYYNGFSPEDRALLSKPQREERYKRGNNPTICCMTGYSNPDDPKGAGYMYTHLEDYREPLDWYPMSKRAHYVLHRRFVDPKPWLRLVGKHYTHGAWFTLLIINVQDMYRTFDEIYPHGLPKHHETWPDYADELGLSQHHFERLARSLGKRQKEPNVTKFTS